MCGGSVDRGFQWWCFWRVDIRVWGFKHVVTGFRLETWSGQYDKRHKCQWGMALYSVKLFLACNNLLKVF